MDVSYFLNTESLRIICHLYQKNYHHSLGVCPCLIPVQVDTRANRLPWPIPALTIQGGKSVQSLVVHQRGYLVALELVDRGNDVLPLGQVIAGGGHQVERIGIITVEIDSRLHLTRWFQIGIPIVLLSLSPKDTVMLGIWNLVSVSDQSLLDRWGQKL